MFQDIGIKAALAVVGGFTAWCAVGTFGPIAKAIAFACAQGW